MAIACVLIGGVIGFATFLLALFKFNTSVLMAVGLYSLTGTAVTALLLLALLLLTLFQQRLHTLSKNEDLTPAGF